MDRGVKQEAFGADSYRREDRVTPLKKVRASWQIRPHFAAASYSRSPLLLPISQESEPWRGSSGFGLANILNRSTPSSAMPKFSLPSLHSFGKPLVTKPEVSLAPPRYEEENQFVSTRQQQQQLSSANSSPARQTSPSPNSRRIAPAPADEEEAEQETENTTVSTRGSNGGTQSIRGGRWTADEHERFLEGFRIHGHKWKRVQQVVRSRSVTQVRTHAQKYLLKVAKLKAEKKQSGKSVDMVTLAAEQPNVAASTESVDGNDTAPSTPEQAGSNGSPRKTPRKKVRRLDHGNCDPVDQEYIAAAATTLCFLMSQKIDSLFDSRPETKVEATSGDFEPYDCYTQQPVRQPDAERSGSRKRSYMHFITEQQEDYSSASYDPAHGEPSSYSIEGSKLCS
jgi:SHAQKYF class myb-like DNA-binding protein